MKVYVIKNEQGQYQTPDISFISSIWQADLFNDYEVAKCYCERGCQVVECELMEKTELSDYTTQVRKEVCEEINQKLCRIEDTLINLGNGKEDTLNYFVGILKEIEQGEKNV